MISGADSPSLPPPPPTRLGDAQHPSLTPYKPYLHLLQAHLTLSSPSPSSNGTTTSKFARTTLRRLLLPGSPFSSSSLSPSSDLASPQATYTLHLTLATLPSTSYAESLASWREVERIARGRGDESMLGVALLGMSRGALSEGVYEVVGRCLDEVGGMMRWDSTSEGSAEGAGVGEGQPLPPGLQVQALLVFALYHAHMGDVKLAKAKLKRAHGLLDAPGGGAGEKEGWVVVGFFSSILFPPFCLTTRGRA